jgi:Flp pilus assembly protein TadG
MRATGNQVRRDGGLAAVEAALLLPLVCLMLFGMIEYGWIFLKAQELNSAAREGARMAIIQSATSAEVIAKCDAMMADAGLGGSGYTLTLSPADISTLTPGQTLSVSITVPFSNIELIGMPSLLVPTTIGGSTSMAKE